MKAKRTSEEMNTIYTEALKRKNAGEKLIELSTELNFSPGNYYAWRASKIRGNVASRKKFDTKNTRKKFKQTRALNLDSVQATESPRQRMAVVFGSVDDIASLLKGNL